MEEVIESFFSGAFLELERDGLGARYKRRGIADYLSSLVGASADTEARMAACRHAVKAACRIHSDAVTSNGSICPLGKHHNILYVALKLSFEWRLRCGPTNAHLLSQIFTCEKTFERLVIAAILGPLVTRLISGWQADFKDAEESMQALEFFLEHACRQMLRFRTSTSPEGLKMVDVPMPSYHDALPTHLACIMGRPSALLLLLRYGARVGQAEHGGWEPGPPPLALLHLLNRLADAAEGRGLGASETGSEGQASVRVLVRAVPHLPLLEDEQLREVAEISGLPRTRWAEPPELKHLARCAVRKQLCKLWRLPDGIKELGIPVTLMPYLDLQED